MDIIGKREIGRQFLRSVLPFLKLPLTLLFCRHQDIFVCYYHVTFDFQSESTLCSLPECQGSPCSKKAPYLKFKLQERDLNPQPLSSLTNNQPCSQTSGNVPEEAHRLHNWVKCFECFVWLNTSKSQFFLQVIVFVDSIPKLFGGFGSFKTRFSASD